MKTYLVKDPSRCSTWAPISNGEAESISADIAELGAIATQLTEAVIKVELEGQVQYLVLGDSQGDVQRALEAAGLR
jgi:hypothetical protein